MMETTTRKRKDWVGNPREFAVAWGLPIAALVGASLFDPLARTLIWAVALVWMGVACLANARRCGRTHCYFTGPFFLIMTVPVLLHGFEILPLGAQGWRWLGATISVGGVALWLLPEFLWGRFAVGPERPD